MNTDLVAVPRCQDSRGQVVCE